jgi:hypothetical protein
VTEQKQLWMVVLIFLFAVCPAACGAAGFQTPHGYTVGTNPRTVAAGDFDGDGSPDLAICDFGDPTTADNGNVSILLGNGNGTFQPAVSLSAVNNCTAVAAGDFDSNGRSDLLVSRSGDSTAGDDGGATVFMSNGDGTFRKGPTLVPGKNPASATANDINADHRLDLIFANRTDSTISILLGNGDGTFQQPVAYTVSNPPSSVEVIDVNGDGKSDLAVFVVFAADLLLGNGDGTFRHGPSVWLGSLHFAMAMADFNKDDALDLVIRGCNFLHPSSCSTSLMVGNLSGGFQPTTVIPDILGAFAADLNGDGNLDLAGRTSDGSQLAIALGNGNGTFQPRSTLNASANLSIGTLADLNGDKAPDLIAISQTSNSISVLLNTGIDFSMSASAPMQRSLTPGQSTTAMLSISLLNSFDNPVSLTCSVRPSQAGSPVCALSSDSVTFDSSRKATATVTITAGSASAAIGGSDADHGASHGTLAWLPLAAFAFIGTGLRCRFRKRRKDFIFLSCGLVALFLQTACSGAGTLATKSTSYAITITGNSGSTQYSATTTVTVLN